MSIDRQYTDRDGSRHHVMVGRDHRGAWTVYDVTADLRCIRQVERLAGDEPHASADAIAASYLIDMRRYLAGERDRMLVAHPAPRAIRLQYTSAAQMPAALREFAAHTRQRRRPDSQSRDGATVAA